MRHIRAHRRYAEGVDLPAPDGPFTTTNSPASKVKIDDDEEHVHLFVGPADLLDDALELQHGIMRLAGDVAVFGGPPGPDQRLVPIANVMHDLQAGTADQLLDVRRGEIARDEVGSDGGPSR